MGDRRGPGDLPTPGGARARTTRATVRGALGEPRPVSGAGRATRRVLAELLARDKKTTARGLASVLLERIGRARVEESVPVEEWLDAAAIMSLS